MPSTASTSTTSSPGNRARLVLEINATAYSARPMAPAELPTGAARGYRLSRDDPRSGRVVYLVTAGRAGMSCSCPAYQFRTADRPECKHLAAARAVALL